MALNLVTMYEQGEKTCPLCEEEMDLTDQQLKPCKCGYQICVWCWHHLMEMAEKDGTEGRCPACRTPYDKEKIVGMAANCERLVSVERKKLQKTKSKTSEGRKQLSSVRVIQRNLVYIIGLPLQLGDEDLLQRKEYFGQYGKVLKVSMSRTSAGVIQQFPNNTCSVYITYSKEEEAVRCIQSVHGFTLEGRPLRACFGTTKYCHAWLRNVPCTNPDCLYLHETGSPEDSFTKDEIISAYTRSRVQQITGPENYQQRSGDVLPPPLDDYDSSKPITRSASSNMENVVKGSPPNGSSARANGLPPAASWAARASNSQPSAASLASSNGLLKQKSDTSRPIEISSTPPSIAQASNTQSYVPKKPILNDEICPVPSKGNMDRLKPVKQYNSVDPRSTSSQQSYSPLDVPYMTVSTSSQLISPTSSGSDQQISMPSNSSDSIDEFGKINGSLPKNEVSVHTHSEMQNLCSGISVMSISKNIKGEQSDLVRPSDSVSEHGKTRSSLEQGLQASIGKASPSINGLYLSTNECDSRSDSQNQTLNMSPEVEGDILLFENQRLKDPEVISRPSYLSNSSNLLSVADRSGSHPFQHTEGHSAVRLSRYPVSVDSKVSDCSSVHEFNGKLVSDGTPESIVQSSGLDRIDHLMLRNNGEEYIRTHQGDAVSYNSNNSLDSGENSIIANILSLDFNSLDESLTSPQNLAKLLGETDMGNASLSKISNSRKVQDNNQSRFSFARQEDSNSQPLDVEPPLGSLGQFSGNYTFNPSSENRDSFLHKFGVANGLSPNSFGESDNFGSSHALSTNKLSASRAKISAPPGFSIPSRLPPPGFTSHESVEHARGLTSGNHLLDASSLLRNSYQTPPTASIGNTGDIEFIDPAIMEIRKGGTPIGLNNVGLDMRPNYSQQLNDEARLQLLMQRSIAQHQNLRYSDIDDNFSLANDSYGINSRLIDQPQISNLSPFAQVSLQQSRNMPTSNGHWNGWNDIQSGNNLGMADFLQNERMGFNKLYSGYDDSKFRIPRSGDLYNRAFGI